MNCPSDKFIINKGMNNEFIITIKVDNGMLPMTISNTDTFKATFTQLDNESISHSVIPTVYDAANGQIKIIVEQPIVDSMISERGSKADKYYMKPTYRLTVECNTSANGNFVTKVSSVYVVN